MRIDILTLFPEMFVPLTESIIGRAVKNEKVEINVVNIRDYTEDKHGKCDDYPFGGGAGMLMMAQPVVSSFKKVDPEHKAFRIYMSPKGRRFEQKHIKKLLTHDHIVLLCGHYEGIDQRALDGCIDDEISIGDYVLTGGELPAMVVTDALCRYIGGVIDDESLKDESFTDNLLEYPQYTRPADFYGDKVPDVLLSGNHRNIDKWRLERAEEITAEKRPDLYRKYIKAKQRAEEKARQEKEKQRAERRALLKKAKENDARGFNGEDNGCENCGQSGKQSGSGDDCCQSDSWDGDLL